jgi:hypothetical protein
MLRPISALRVVLLSLLLSLLLTGCGAGKASSTPPPKIGFGVSSSSSSKPNDIKSSGVSGATDCSTLTAKNNNEFCVAVEANNKMIAANQPGSWLFNLLTPKKAYAYLGLSNITVQNLQVVQLGVGMGPTYTATIPSYSYQITSSGVYRLTFSQSPTLRIDLAVKVTLKNGAVLYAPLVAKDVAVNVMSNYQVTQFFNSLTTSSDLDNVIPCIDTTNCTNQYTTKFVLWGALTGLLQGYEVVIPTDANIQAANSLLEQNGDLNNQMQRFFNAIKKPGEFYVGTQPPTNLNNTVGTTVSKSFSTIAFAFGFDPILSSATSAATSNLVTLISKVAKTANTNGATPYHYPNVTLSDINVGIRFKSLLPDLPVERQVFTSNADNTFSLATDSELNSFTPQASNLFLGKDGFLTESRTPLQNITQKGYSTKPPLGWQYNPSFDYLYQSWNENSGGTNTTGTEGLFTSFQSTGAIYTLTPKTDGSGGYSRNQLIEPETFFSFISHLRETDDQKNVSKNIAISGKDWGVVSFLLKPQASSSVSGATEILKASVSTYKWSTTSSAVTQTQPASTLPTQYETLSIGRLDNLNLVPLNSKSDSSLNYMPMSALVNHEDGTSSTNSSVIQQVERYRGRIQIFPPNDNGTSRNIGAYSKDGSAISLILNDDTGRGFLQAIEMRSSTPVIGGDTTYYLQGNSFGMTSNNNIARNYSDSNIVFHSDGTCTLNLKIREATQNTTSRTVSGITDVNSQATDPSIYKKIAGTYKLNKGEVQINFSNVEGTSSNPLPMTLKGFISKSYTTNTDNPGNLMILSLEHNNNLGMLYGFKEQSLTVNP